jgi:hypothetical protein
MSFALALNATHPMLAMKNMWDVRKNVPGGETALRTLGLMADYFDTVSL